MNSKFLDYLFGYERSEGEFLDSRIRKAEKNFADKTVSGISTAFSKKLRQSKISKLFTDLKRALALASVKSYSILFLCFGFLTLLLNFAEYYFLSVSGTLTASIIEGAILTVIGIALFFIDVPLATAVQRWKVTNFLLFDVFCLKKI